MARVCYDPRAAVGLWQRMEEEEKASGVAVPQFLSTHPSSRNRIGLIRGWLAQAEEVGRESGCAGVGGNGELASGEVLGSGDVLIGDLQSRTFVKRGEAREGLRGFGDAGAGGFLRHGGSDCGDGARQHQGRV